MVVSMKRFIKRVRFLFKFHKSVPFVKDFFISKKIKRATKLLYTLLIIGYIAFPFDVIPDFLSLFGILDDITIAVLLLQQMIKAAPDSLKEKHEFLD